MTNHKLSIQEKKFLSLVSDDYVALAEVVGYIVMDTNKYSPTESDYLKALVFISYLLHKYGDRIKYYIGPGVEIIHKSPEEFIDWLKEMWYKGQYKEIDFGVWFDMETEEENLSN